VKVRELFIQQSQLRLLSLILPLQDLLAQKQTLHQQNLKHLKKKKKNKFQYLKKNYFKKLKKLFLLRDKILMV